MEVDSSKLKSALTRNRKFILDNVSDVKPLLDFLADDLNDDEKENIKALPASKEQVRKLLEILGFRVKLLPKFYLALKFGKYNDAAEALAKEMPQIKELSQQLALL